jgi:putative membrane protein
MTLDAQSILESWSAPLGINAALCLSALVYLRGWFRLHTVFSNLISVWRLVAFLSGVVLVWIAIGSPLNAFDEVSLSVHMLQHLLLMAIAPLLVLLGSPVLPLLQGIPQSVARRALGPLLRSSWVKSIGHFVTNPTICWFAAALALIGWHIPAVFEPALRWEWLHALEHACFFGTGLLFWWPVVQPWPSIARWPRWLIPLYLFCATLPCDLLSGFLAFCDRVVYSSYLSAPHLFGFSPLEDQQCAAALMWVCVTVIFLVPAVVITMQILSPHRFPSEIDSSAGLHRIAGQSLGATKLEVS